MKIVTCKTNGQQTIGLTFDKLKMGKTYVKAGEKSTTVYLVANHRGNIALVNLDSSHVLSRSAFSVNVRFVEEQYNLIKAGDAECE